MKERKILRSGDQVKWVGHDGYTYGFATVVKQAQCHLSLNGSDGTAFIHRHQVTHVRRKRPAITYTRLSRAWESVFHNHMRLVFGMVPMHEKFEEFCKHLEIEK